MKLLALILALALPAQAQAPLEVEEQSPLVAKPTRDLFDFATLIYNTAGEEKDAAKQKKIYRQAADKFDLFLKAFPNDEKALDSWYFLALCYRQIGEDDASRKCFETAATNWTEGKFVEASALFLASDDEKAEKWRSAAKWFEITAKVTDDPKIQQESLYRRFLCFSKLEDNTATLLSLKEVLKDEDSPFAGTARLALARLYQRTKSIRQAHEQYVLLSDSPRKEVRAEAVLQAALTAQELKDRELSKKWFARALEEDTLKDLRGKTQLALMGLYYESKEWDQVIATYRAGNFKLDQENELQRLNFAAKSFEALKQDDEAFKLYELYSKLAPGSATSFHVAYRILLRDHAAKARDFAKSAESFLTSHAKEHAKDAKVQSVRLLLAELYYDEKNFKRAIAHYRNLDLALIDGTNQLRVRYHVAKTQLALGDESGSLAAIAHFVKLFPKSRQATQLRLDRAELLTSKGREAEAVSDYDSVLAATDDADLKRIILLRLSAVYQKTEEWEKFTALQEKILLLPDLDTKTEASAHFWLGWNEVRLKQSAKAMPYLLKARELDPATFAPKVGPLLLSGAYKSEDTDLLEKEIKILRSADPKAPVPAPMLTWLGATLSKEGQHERAWPFLREGLSDQEKTSSNLIWRLFGDSSLKLGKFEAAVVAADAILATEEHPFRKAEALYMKSQAFSALKKFNEARQAASDALDFRPQGDLDVALRMHAGDIDIAEGKPGEAIRHYVVVDSLYAKTPEAKAEARAKVIATLKAIGTPESLEKLKNYR